MIVRKNSTEEGNPRGGKENKSSENKRERTQKNKKYFTRGDMYVYVSRIVYRDISTYETHVRKLNMYRVSECNIFIYTKFNTEVDS